jgi:hypothetical protein
MAQDPEQTVIDSITQPGGKQLVTGRSPGGVQSVVVTGGPLVTATADSIRFIKERRGTNHRLYAVSYTDQDGRPHLDFVGIAQSNDGSWTRSGGAGGSGQGPPRDRPWVNFGGWWGPELFCAGGEVIGTDAELSHLVELVFGDRTTLQDTVDNGLVLFLQERTLRPPAVAKITDKQGNLLAEHVAFPTATGPSS